jgi:hypothetical protein
MWMGAVMLAQSGNHLLVRPSLQEIPLIEKKKQGRKINYRFNITVSQNYFPGAASLQLANPLVYTRPDSGGRTEVSYFYSEPDRKVRLIEYSYDRPASDSNFLKRMFADNDRFFTNHFKKPGSLTAEAHDNWWQQLQVWESDTVYLKQFIVIGDGTYRVRVLVSWGK